MKHPVQTQQRHTRMGVEWIQAIGTLLVLISIYSMRNGFDSYAYLPPPTQGVQQAQGYWNDILGYGFQGDKTDKYTASSASGHDVVAVDTEDSVVFQDARVRVSFYQNTPIDQIEASHVTNTPRAYSRLPNGIAVIEGDLSSSSAKNVLATLHSR